MQDIRTKLDAQKSKTAEMDLYKNELKDRIYVIDSSQVVGAQVILNWIKKKKESVKNAQRKISLARRKTLF